MKRLGRAEHEIYRQGEKRSSGRQSSIESGHPIIGHLGIDVGSCAVLMQAACLAVLPALM